MADTRSLMPACGLAALWGAAALCECVGKSHVSLLVPIYILCMVCYHSRYYVS
jgi:hypothetical protein